MFIPHIKHKEIWVIGYGNPRRGDDGIGPYIVNTLKKKLRFQKGLYFRSVPQLTPDLIKDLQDAAFIIFIDATVNTLKKGWRLFKVKPNFEYLPFLTHHVSPAFLLSLLQSAYKRYPSTWLLSVQGYDFGLEEDFYPDTKINIDRAISFIFRLVNKMINNKCAVGVKKHRRILWEMEQIY